MHKVILTLLQVFVNEAWDEWLGLIEQFMSATIPCVKVKANRSHKSVP